MPRHARQVKAWQSATPAASASSGASGRPCPSRLITVPAICSLLARPMVAMVGARNPSSLGLRTARKLHQRAVDVPAADEALVHDLELE